MEGYKPMNEIMVEKLKEKEAELGQRLPTMFDLSCGTIPLSIDVDENNIKKLNVFLIGNPVKDKLGNQIGIWYSFPKGFKFCCCLLFIMITDCDSFLIQNIQKRSSK
jgi:hypothetical protein